MSRDRKKLRYAKTHEWVQIEADKATVGITEYAAGQLQDLVFVDLPDEGSRFGAGDVFGSIESVKAVSELYAPVSGKVTRVNRRLEEDPDLVSNDPFGEGWMIGMEFDEPVDLADLMNEEAYEAMTAEED